MIRELIYNGEAKSLKIIFADGSEANFYGDMAKDILKVIMQYDTD